MVAAKIAGHVADPGHIVARASRGEHGCGETPADCGRVEEDRRFGADELSQVIVDDYYAAKFWRPFSVCFVEITA
jgi:hypothetical protein